MQVQASHTYQMPALFSPTCKGALQMDCCSCAAMVISGMSFP